jgi:hypothetical protein
VYGWLHICQRTRGFLNSKTSNYSDQAVRNSLVWNYSKTKRLLYRSLYWNFLHACNLWALLVNQNYLFFQLMRVNCVSLNRKHYLFSKALLEHNWLLILLAQGQDGIWRLYTSRISSALVRKLLERLVLAGVGEEPGLVSLHRAVFKPWFIKTNQHHRHLFWSEKHLLVVLTPW